MRLTKSFEVTRPRDDVVELLCSDETLLGLTPHGDTVIVQSNNDHRTTRTHYRILGVDGVATFHFTFLLDGGLHFEKKCDGNVWKQLGGSVCVEEVANGRCSVEIEIHGKTKKLVPEFTIKAPMEEQIRDMTIALEERLHGGAPKRASSPTDRHRWG